MQKKILWFMCGLPGSGKTTVIKRYFPKYKVIAADDFDTEYLFQKALVNEIQHTNSLLIDGCFENKETRVQALTNLLNYTPQDVSYEINFCVINCDIDTCIARNEQRVPHGHNKQVTAETITQRSTNFTDPATDELPYSNIMYLDKYGNLLGILQGEQFQ